MRYSGGKEGGRTLGVMGVGSVQEAGEERMGERISTGGGSREEIGNEICNIVQYLATEKAYRGGNH